MPLTTPARTIERTATKLPSFCIVLPVHNEESVLGTQIPALWDALLTYPTQTAIIAVNDGSTDSSGKVLNDLQLRVPGLIVETHAKNGGYGAANRTGFAAAIREGFEYALVMDADGTQDPRFIAGFLTHMQRGVDFIKATRYVHGSKVTGVDWRRKLISYLGNKLAGVLLPLPITDYTNGFRAVKTSLLKQIKTNERGFAVLIEEVARAKDLGASFAEVPYELTVRAAEGSQSKFSYAWKVYLTYLKHLVK